MPSKFLYIPLLVGSATSTIYSKFESLTGSAVDLNKDLNVTQNQRKNKKSGKSEKSDLCLFGYKAFFFGYKAFFLPFR